MFRRLLHLLSRPVRKDSTAGSLAIHPFRGYGNGTGLFLMGRVVRQPAAGHHKPEPGLFRDLKDTWRRLRRHGVAGIAVTARFGEAERTVDTDADGYFRLRLHFPSVPPRDRLWHRVRLTASTPGGEVNARGEFFVPPEQARHVIISDIDDTVMLTGVANKALMLWRLFVQGPRSRLAFPGVGALYRALHAGASGRERNPILYLSRGPWALYDLLDEFFRLHRIPVGPILFLREWGIRAWRPIPRRAEGHKRKLLGEMLDLYGDLPFVLIGDSGQHDPEIYARAVREHPDRVAAVYIRNVSRDPAREAAIKTLAEEVAAAGSTLLLAADSDAMARHAADRGLIAGRAVARVEQESADGGETTRHPVRQVRHKTGDTTRRAVERGELERRLEESPDAVPPNVVVESERKGGKTTGGTGRPGKDRSS